MHQGDTLQYFLHQARINRADDIQKVVKALSTQDLLIERPQINWNHNPARPAFYYLYCQINGTQLGLDPVMTETIYRLQESGLIGMAYGPKLKQNLERIRRVLGSRDNIRTPTSEEESLVRFSTQSWEEKYVMPQTVFEQNKESVTTKAKA